MHVLLHQLIAITTAQFAGLRTGILDDTGLVEQEDGGILAVEDRPVTQGALVFELFQAVGFGDILLRADDYRRLAVAVALQHGEVYDKVVQLVVAALHILCFQLNRQFFLFMASGILMLADQTVERSFQPFEVAFFAVTL